MKMTRKKLLALLFLVGLAAFLLWFNASRPLVKKSAEVHWISYYNENITEQVNLEDLKNLLCTYKKRRTLKTYFPYRTEDLFIEIGVIDEGEPRHILLGKSCIYYRSGEWITEVWEIQNGEDLLEKVLSLTGETEQSRTEKQ